MRKGRSPYQAFGPFLCLLLASCGEQTTPSAREAEQLDNAEALLDAAPAELSNIDASALEERDADGTSPDPAD